MEENSVLDFGKLKVLSRTTDGTTCQEGCGRIVESRVIDRKADGNAARRFLLFWIVSYNVFLNMHCPDSAQRLQTIQPCTDFVPMYTISVSTPLVFQSFCHFRQGNVRIPPDMQPPLINSTLNEFLWWKIKVRF